MNQRTYNKLYVNKNREGSSENLTFGYQHNEKEIVFKKDTETFFHIPTYTSPLKLSETNLIANGASGGAFPAASDRILKSRKNYGSQTNNGTPSGVSDGTWFCSWLYRNPYTGTLQWMDRFYNPGKFDYSLAKAQLLEYPPYVRLDPIFKDLPSQMTFEPGVLYRYFHYGEKSFDELLTTFAGASSEHLKLYLLNWGKDSVDSSKSNIEVVVKSDASLSDLYPVVNEVDRTLNPVIGFDHESNVECYLNYDETYTPAKEFTWTLWSQSNKWQDNVSTQLIGNYSTLGGVGVFLDTLETYPIITIPETAYGHVLVLNQQGYKVFDKTLQKSLAPVNPICFALDSNDHILVCNNDTAGVIYKMDHVGKIVRSTKNLSDPDTLFAFSLSGELPRQVLCGRNDDFHVITNKGVYVFDNDLKLKQTIPQVIPTNSIAAFSYNVEEDTEELVITNNVKDIKFVESTSWSINLSGNLFKNSELFYQFGDASALSIGPDGNIWVLHGNNKCSVVDPNATTSTAKISLVFSAGTNVVRSSAKKNISFIKQFNRKTNTKDWYCVIYYSDEKKLYFYDVRGKLTSTSNIVNLFDSNIIKNYSQNREQFQLLSTGDFTGYERKRIFNQLSPYSSKPQIVLKASVKDLSKDSLFFKTFKTQYPIDQWEEESWKHLVLTYKNKTFQLWSNAAKLFDLQIGGQYEVSYDMQPAFYVGTPVGNSLGLNQELNHTTSIFNGKIGDIRIFDYSLPHFNIESFVRASIVGHDLYWPMPIPSTQYVEQVERLFKHKMPGAKSQFFNIKLQGTQITDPLTRQIIEAELKEIVQEITPTYSDLLKIEWI